MVIVKFEFDIIKYVQSALMLVVFAVQLTARADVEISEMNGNNNDEAY
jgi:hypothetical protein